jgi:hypothetical protein
VTPGVIRTPAAALADPYWIATVRRKLPGMSNIDRFAILVSDTPRNHFSNSPFLVPVNGTSARAFGHRQNTGSRL